MMTTADQVRSFALSLPEAYEQEHWGKASFRVRNKIFAVIQEDGNHVVVKATPEDRMAYTEMDPDVFRVPDSFTRLNYMLVQMNLVDEAVLQRLLVQSWRMVAPKRVVAQWKGQ